MNDQPNPEHTKSEENELSTLKLHEHAMNEISEPSESMFIGPIWFYLLLVLALVIAAFYFGRHMGRLDTAAHIGFLQKQEAQQTNQTSNAVTSVSGAPIFTSRCSTCHQADGKGIPGAFPPLLGASYVLGDAETVVRIVLHGLQGEIEVSGQKYNGLMPPWASQLKDEEIAAVVNYVRTELGGNKATAIDAALVAQIRDATKDRQAPWTANELEAVKSK